MKPEEKALGYIAENNLLEKGDTVIVGVSGGADSMCMLSILLKMREPFELKLSVVHVNHGIRGESADRDEIFVKDFCEKNGVEFCAYHADIPKMAADERLTEEEAGRKYRYAVFEKAAEEKKAGKIAVAHNRDDNAETVLFNILRGSGLSGIRGIRPLRRINDGKKTGPVLIRPVLALKRSEIEEYLKENGIAFCTDETNLHNDYGRNKIRNILLPQAEALFNGCVREHLAELSAQVSAAEDFISKTADEFISEKVSIGDAGTEVPTEDVKKLHSAVRGVVLRKMIDSVCHSLKDIELRHIRALESLLDDDRTGRKCNLPYGILAEIEYGKLVLRRPKEEQFTEDCPLSYEVIDYCPGQELPILPYTKWFDYDKIQNVVTLRHRRDGDYLVIDGNGHRKSLNRLFIDSKVPERKRDLLWLLTEGSHVLYVEGMRRDQSCLVEASTKRILVLTDQSAKQTAPAEE